MAEKCSCGCGCSWTVAEMVVVAGAVVVPRTMAWAVAGHVASRVVASEKPTRQARKG